MDKNNNLENNTDFQVDIEEKSKQNIQDDILLDNENVISQNNLDNTNNETKNNSDTEVIPTEIISETISANEISTENNEVVQSVENKNCTLDHKKDEKLKNIMTYTSIPFILVAIVISLFNIGRVRQPLSFLFLALGIIVLAVCKFIRSRQIANSCSCKQCTQQSKSSFKFAIIYTIAALGLIGAFIYFMVVPN